jgi:peptide-methionine (S)-S-oxide reductase
MEDDPMKKILMAAVLALTATVAQAQMKTDSAIFAGGCFWCVESDFDPIPGVTETLSGYTGGMLVNPTYKQVGGGGTGHYEAVKVTLDPSKVTYEQLLTAFWHSVDVTDDGGQFCDRGEVYRPAVFVNGPEQRKIAEASKAAAEKELGQKIKAPILDAKPFYAAEGYHQDYYKKNPLQYKFYRWNCGRNQRNQALWGEAAYKGIPKH